MSVLEAQINELHYFIENSFAHLAQPFEHLLSKLSLVSLILLFERYSCHCQLGYIGESGYIIKNDPETQIVIKRV